MRILLLLAVTAALAACGPPLQPSPGGPSVPAPQEPGTPQPDAPPPVPGEEPTSETPTPPPVPPPKQFRLGAASSALVGQARKLADQGEFASAIATLERAQRIEPENPLLWIELGRVHQEEGNAAQADSMGRKALALATGDPSAQSAAWRLIADSLRSRGRNQEASEALRRAEGGVPR
jgi:tetratricopeptide (TPR) repeat protein